MSHEHHHHHHHGRHGGRLLIRILLFPFWAIWELVTFILGLTGRLIAGVLGLVLMIVGFVLTVTIVGAIVGIPLVILGFSLMMRAIF
jgi:hypothetical protein